MKTTWFIVIATTFLGACKTPPPPPSGDGCLELPHPTGTPVARVGDMPLVVEQLAARIRQQGSAAVRRNSEPKRMRDYVEDQVRFELLVRAGLERGLHRDPDVVEAARKVMVRKLLERDMGNTVFKPVTDDQVQRYYDKHRDEYMQPEKRRFADIQLAPTEEGRTLGESILAKLHARPDDRNLFRLLSTKHTLRKAIKTPGLTDLFKSRIQVDNQYGASFADEIFQTPADTLFARPVQSTKGWHVVKLFAIREELTRSVDDVRDDIRDRLRKGERSKAFEQYLTGLKKRHPVAIYDGRIDDVITALKANPEPTKPKSANP